MYLCLRLREFSVTLPIFCAAKKNIKKPKQHNLKKIKIEQELRMPEFDNQYSQLLTECGGNLVPFLDSIFGFLYRRSDFFKIKDEAQQVASSVVGFTPGQNIKLLNAVFNKWEKFAQNEREREHKLAQADVPPAVNEEVIETTANNAQKIVKSTHKRIENDPQNGADLGKYKWSQTATEIEITVPVDQTIKKGNQIDINLKKDSLTVSNKAGGILIEGNLFSSVKPSELVWNLMPGSHILISLEKAKEGPLWTKCFTFEEENLNKNSFDISEPYKDMTESDKMAVEYAIDQQKKKEDSSSKSEQDLEKILKKAWNAEGSPFVGTPFDPSVISNIKK